MVGVIDKPLEQQFSSFVIGKVDAGVAVLISESVHLIEFPSLLLPPGVGPGSIVNISCTRDITAEQKAIKDFWELQNSILSEFGSTEPRIPEIRIRNITQTSVTLEWDELDLAKADLLSLEIWRNGSRLSVLGNPRVNTSTKLSGLAVETNYTFHLVLKTSAGNYTSPIIKLKTHSIENTSGISITLGSIPSPLLEETIRAIESMGGKWSNKVEIDTSHFITTRLDAKDLEQEKAEKLSLAVLEPGWILACQKEGKMVSIASFLVTSSSGGGNNQVTGNSFVSNNGISSAQNVGGRAPVELMRNGSSGAGSSSGTRRVNAVIASPIEISSSPIISELAEEEPESPGLRKEEVLEGAVVEEQEVERVEPPVESKEESISIEEEEEKVIESPPSPVIPLKDPVSSAIPAPEELEVEEEVIGLNEEVVESKVLDVNKDEEDAMEEVGL